jgi:hypothetical protein
MTLMTVEIQAGPCGQMPTTRLTTSAVRARLHRPRAKRLLRAVPGIVGAVVATMIAVTQASNLQAPWSRFPVCVVAVFMALACAINRYRRDA